MVGLALAISDLMILILSSALWTAGGIALAALAGVGAIGGIAIAIRRLRR